MTGTATDDVGVQLDQHDHPGRQQPLPPGRRHRVLDGNTFRITPDVVGATSTTWSQRDHRAHGGRLEGTGQRRRHGRPVRPRHRRPVLDRQRGRRGARVSVSAPAAMVPPTAAQTLVVAPGGPLTFSGSANDDEGLNSVEIKLRNNTTRENLASGRHLGHRRRPGLVPHLAGQPERHQLQLELHHAVQPQAGQLLLRGPGDRRARAHHSVREPGQAQHQRPGARGRSSGRHAERDRHGHRRPVAEPLPCRQGDRRQGCRGACGSRCSTATPASTCSPTAPWQRRSPLARRPWPRPNATVDELDAPGRPAQGRATGTSPRSPSTPSSQQDTSTVGATARYRIYPGTSRPS